MVSQCELLERRTTRTAQNRKNADAWTCDCRSSVELVLEAVQSAHHTDDTGRGPMNDLTLRHGGVGLSQSQRCCSIAETEISQRVEQVL